VPSTASSNAGNLNTLSLPGVPPAKIILSPGNDSRVEWSSAGANRSNHYEAAFEAFVRSHRIPCVAVDEASVRSMVRSR